MDTATSLYSATSGTGSSLRPYNEVSVADRVVKACAWTDDSADFVFGDGTVLSFCDEMQTFVALEGGNWKTKRATNAGASSRDGGGVEKRLDGREIEGDYYFTALTLSKYEKKVREALHIYNHYSLRPRVITGLTVTPCEVWRQRSPIDSLIIAADPRLFKRNGQHATLWCALHRVSLTLHSGRMAFSVRWPAPAVERNGARSIFVRPVDEHGFPIGTLDSLKAFHYTWVEQTFPILDPPSVWTRMLGVALRLDAEVPFDDSCHTSFSATHELGTVRSLGDSTGRGGNHQNNVGGREERSVFYETTPETAQDRTPCRFSRMKLEDAHALIATSQMQCALCNRRIRDSREQVVWRYDADPTGRIPHAVYWGLHVRRRTGSLTHPLPTMTNANISAVACSASAVGEAPNHFSNGAAGSVFAVVREDGSAVLAEPSGRSYVVHHWRSDGTHKMYHQSPDGSIALPPVIPQEDANGTENADAAKCAAEGLPHTMGTIRLADNGLTTLAVNEPLLYFGGALEESPFAAAQRGRYLPSVGGSCIDVSQLNIAPHRSQLQEAFTSMSVASPSEITDNIQTNQVSSARAKCAVGLFDRTRLRILSNDPALIAAAEAGSVVHITTAIEGVGNFTALTNGTIRCHFDDRTILFLIPGADDLEENLLATCIFRDASQLSIRLVKCPPTHPIHRYLSYALQFRRFVRLSPEARQVVAEDLSSLRLELPANEACQAGNVSERYLQQLLERTQELLSGNDELRRANQFLLRNESSAYFTRKQ
ncbi:putative protein of unknown function (DUF4520) [Trypanosoma vivax]|nr:hypothetical protein TRVL_02658 [Trypanosoma vivax]KAH8617412.1 putative protein of unknown function (DUF4520) [Trypanosoma vivax]